MKLRSPALLAVSLIAAVSLASPAHAAVSPGSDRPDVLPFTMLESKIVYIRPGAFTAETARRTRPTLRVISTSKPTPRGLILDLRNNHGGSLDAVHALLESLLPKGTPYMRDYSSGFRRLAVTIQEPVFKRSMPIVVLRNERTVNEPDIVIYALQKIRKAGLVEFSPHRAALLRIYKQHARMQQVHPIKEGVFTVVPDARIIGDEGGDEGDVIPRAVSFIRELSPWDEGKMATGK